jgi:hypothetical protein
MRVYLTDVTIPINDERAMQASGEIEEKVGPCDTGAGFGWRDIEVQSESEDDQAEVVRMVGEVLTSYGIEYAVNESNMWGRERASVRTRSVDPAEDEPEIEQPRGLIGPGYEE